MSTGPADDDAGDIDPADLDDLGELGGGDEDDDPDEKDDKPYVAPDKDAWDKVQRKLARQEERITRLTGKQPNGKPVATKGKPSAADVDRQLLDQIRGKGKPSAAEPDDEDDGEAERWKGIAIQNAAASQIAAAGFSGTARQAARLARLIDTTGVTPGRDGSFDLEDEIDELKDEYPQLFAQPGESRRAPRVRRAPADDTPKKDPSKTTSDKMLRSAGYR